MTEIKGKVKDITNILELATINCEVEDLVLDCKDDKITTLVIDPISNSFFAILEHNVQIVKEGKLCIISSEALKKFLSSFMTDDEIRLYSNEKEITIERKFPFKKISFKEGDSSLIQSYKNTEKLADKLTFENNTVKTSKGALLNCHFEVDASIFKDIISDSKLLDQKTFTLDAKKDLKLIIQDEEGSKIESVVVTTKLNGEATSSYSNTLEKALSNLYGNVDIYYGNDKPIVFVKVDEKFKLTYFFVPQLVTENVEVKS